MVYRFAGQILLKETLLEAVAHSQKRENADLVAYVMRNKNVKTRVITAVIGFIIALGAITFGGLVYDVLNYTFSFIRVA